MTNNKLTKTEQEIIDRFILDNNFQTVTPAHIRIAIGKLLPERRVDELLDYNYDPEEYALFEQYMSTFNDV